MQNAACIRLDRVCRTFGIKEVIKEISLQVDRSDIFGLLGPSGSGKTALVKMIAGIDEATSGDVYVLGERMPKLSHMQQIGYMGQSDALYAELTAQENLEFFCALYGLGGADKKRRMQEVMELVNLGAHMKQQVARYSGGMKRRLSLAVALLHQPPVLILDEPTVGIDPVLRQSIWSELEQLSRSGTTIVVTTHVMDEAERCGQLGMIRDGTLIAAGTPEALKKDTGSVTLEQAFLHFGGAAS